MRKPQTTKPAGKSTGGPSAEPGTETAPSDGGKVAPKGKPAAPEKAPKEAAPEKAPKETTPEKARTETAPDPTRYGDWEKKGRCIDF
ncbi:MAG: DUF1674 domain-containing protein [Alphaproteobacteria bacterium]|nr:DUF1674 domain-containing protein [Alphaproteobacteria bacterium]